MLFKGFGLGLFIVVATVMILGTFGQTYEDFLTKHYDYPKTNTGGNYCNKMMQRRGMTKPKCKEVNSFIHGTKKNIIAVCGTGGEAIDDRLRRSKEQFQVTTCKMKGSSTKPPCKYRENQSLRYIVIACENDLPVHYEEGEI